jgi:predicted regulator of amino acid metabolism with ACT domain
MYAAWESTPTQIAQTIDSNRQTVLGFIEQIHNKAEDIIDEAEDAETPPGEFE